jgi:hypothetical protein
VSFQKDAFQSKRYLFDLFNRFFSGWFLGRRRLWFRLHGFCFLGGGLFRWRFSNFSIDLANFSMFFPSSLNSFCTAFKSCLTVIWFRISSEQLCVRPYLYCEISALRPSFLKNRAKSLTACIRFLCASMKYPSVSTGTRNFLSSGWSGLLAIKNLFSLVA